MRLLRRERPKCQKRTPAVFRRTSRVTRRLNQSTEYVVAKTFFATALALCDLHQDDGVAKCAFTTLMHILRLNGLVGADFLDVCVAAAVIIYALNRRK